MVGFSQRIKGELFFCLLVRFLTFAKPGEGIVITRNRTGAANLWPLASSSSGPGSWYVLQTNYDHWKVIFFFFSLGV